MASINGIPQTNHVGMRMIGKSDNEKEMRELADMLVKHRKAEEAELKKTPVGRAWLSFSRGLSFTNRQSPAQLNCGS